MKLLHNFIIVSLLICLVGCTSVAPVFRSEVSPRANAWTHLNFYDNPDNFTFAIVSDLYGRNRPGVFEQAIVKLNLLKPEFVVTVGDLIEGNTEDNALLDQQWDQFGSWVNELYMPFFYVPGNHDIGNEVMAKKWQQRFGRSYYYFIYHNVLFLCLNTEDTSKRNFTDVQLKYFEKVINNNQHVRHTILFMHQPLFQGKQLENWQALESLLKSRPYTVFAGHTHVFEKSIRNDNAYYLLSTTGGVGEGIDGEPLGVDQCQFDHITWVTMTETGPEVANILLEGVLDDELCRKDVKQ